jgi:hypothetical protein
MTYADLAVGLGCGFLIILGLTLMVCDLADRACNWINNRKETDQ